MCKIELVSQSNDYVESSLEQHVSWVYFLIDETITVTLMRCIPRRSISLIHFLSIKLIY